MVVLVGRWWWWWRWRRRGEGEGWGVEGVAGGAEDGLGAVAEEAAGEKLGLELWLMGFHRGVVV